MQSRCHCPEKFTSLNPVSIHGLIIISFMSFPDFSRLMERVQEVQLPPFVGTLIFRILNILYFQAQARHIKPGMVIARGTVSGYGTAYCIN